MRDATLSLREVASLAENLIIDLEEEKEAA